MALIYEFDEYEVDAETFELRRDGEPVHVEPQVFGVLVHLIEHRDRVVSKIELLDEVWTDRFVSESALTSRIQAARKACGDNGRDQRVIQTRHGRGYRFVAEIAAASPRSSPERPPRSSVVGRDEELTHLEFVISGAVNGRGSMTLLAGSAGSGKSTLVDAAIERSDAPTTILEARCHPHRGIPEPYVSLLDALGRLGRQHGPQTVEVIERVAPMWLMQLPSLVDADRADTLDRRTMGGTHQRMLREGVDLLFELAAVEPTILVIEDLHWADPSTLEVLQWLAERVGDGPLATIGTYRPDEDLHDALEPLLARLNTNADVDHMRLGSLDPEALRQLALDRLEASSIEESLVEILYLHSGGNPLFATEEVALWSRDGAIEVTHTEIVAVSDVGELRGAVPSGVRQLIEQGLDRLDPEHQQILEAGALIGREFPAFGAAAAIDVDVEVVERGLATLARAEQFVTALGDEAWPDGTVSTDFRLSHDVHQQILQDRLSASARAAMHQRIGERLELAYRHRADEHVTILARHFKASGDTGRAVKYLKLTGEQALARSAHTDAVQAFEQSLEMLANLPVDDHRHGIEVSIRTSLGPALIATKGWHSPEIDTNYARALELCELLHPIPERFIIRYGLASVHELRGEYNLSQELLEQQLSDGPELGVEALELLACSTFHQGRFERSLDHANAGLESWDQSQHSAYMARYGEHPGVSCNTWGALAAWHLGQPRLATQMADQAVEWGALNHYALATARVQYAFLHQYRNDREACRAWAESTIEIATAQGFPFRTAQADTLSAWSRIGHGADLAELSDALGEYRRFGARMDEPYFLGLLADAAIHSGDLDAAETALNEAEQVISETTRTFFFEAELRRLRASAVHARGGRDALVLELLDSAADMAATFAAKPYSLRIALSVIDFGFGTERARKTLRELVSGYDEDASFADLETARQLLD